MHDIQLLLRPDLGKKAYRLKCRFRIGALPRRDLLDKAKVQAAEWFVVDMRKQGFEYIDRFAVTMRGPFPCVDPMPLQKPKRLTARQMLAGILQGNKYRAANETLAQNVLPLGESEHWEYELSMVFAHKTMLAERPDKHEELHP